MHNQTSATQTPLIQFDGIVKRFGGVTAVRGVTLSVRPGEILALLGENGAGKSTLIKTLAGIHDPDEGVIYYRGAPYRHRPPTFGQRQPVAFIHQDLGLVDWMTIAENIALAIGYPQKRGIIDWRAAEAATSAAMAQVNCPLDPTMRVRDLTRTEKSLVAIARALAVESNVLVLDEPSASLPADEVHRLFDALRPLKARGVGMIYVSHRLDEVFEIADRIAVLRDGSLVGERSVAETSPEELVSLIVGKALERFEGSTRVEDHAPRLEAKKLAVEGAGPVDFAVAKSEIVGLVGLRGAGHERIGRALFGSMTHKGEIWLDGKRLNLIDAAAAMAAGIGLVARERVDESTAAGLSIRENTFVNPGAVGRGIASFLSPRREARMAREIGARVGLRPNAPDLPIEALSGGNQQKVVVGRWLAIGGKVLIAEDPTAGVDVGAKAEIYRLLDEALKTGLCVVVVSTDFEEVARLCHRALVFSRGEIVAELSDKDITIERLIHAASVSGRAA
ncbi:sugar ABC transporter ATP-binding protein [Methylocapsa sp. S129]|uniref:sugar ABC transporter ATP-binding protein n=1 Tax=Methylocapsa sp. S129 TaxID=1641869 RepID=UPI00131E4D51|nr:sugar ABC transporter ATP-binding protein [Methylocapsa sp. S129]